MKKILLNLICLLGNLSVNATEYAPWYGTPLELESHLTSFVELYSSVETGNETKKQKGRDVFLIGGLSFAVLDSFSAEIEVLTADTYQQRFDFDSAVITGRYRWLNDLIGDPLSLSTGISLIPVAKAGKKNLGLFHHSSFDYEGHVSLGKEYSHLEYWSDRVWGLVAVGSGICGSAWIRADGAWEHNWYNHHQVKLFLNSRWGLGHDHLNLKHVDAYGKIAHQSLDIGARYTYHLNHGIALNFEYAFRPYAQNCPRLANFFLVDLLYPFGL